MASRDDKLKAIIGLDSSLQNIQDLDILLERILHEARQFTAADSGTIYIKRGDQLAFAYSQNETLQSGLAPGKKLPRRRIGQWPFQSGGCALGCSRAFL